MRVKLVQTGAHADWAKDEIIVLQVVGEKDDVGAYECETLETFAPDLKEQHATQLEQIHAHYAEQHNNLVVRHVNTVDELSALLAKANQEIARLTPKEELTADPPKV